VDGPKAALLKLDENNSRRLERQGSKMRLYRIIMENQRKTWPTKEKKELTSLEENKFRSGAVRQKKSRAETEKQCWQQARGRNRAEPASKREGEGLI